MRTTSLLANNPENFPELYENVVQKRMVAYVIDILICAFVGFVATIFASFLGVVTFGLLFGPLMVIVGLIPFIYNTYLIGTGENATIGMRFMGVKVYTITGSTLTILQAFVHVFLYYLTVPTTSFLILFVCLFNVHRRCLHDIVAGTIVLNNIVKPEDGI